MRARLLWIKPLLTLATVTLLIIAIARPREGRQQTVTRNDGIAMELVVDRSGSMQAMDFHLNEEPVDRLTAIKNVVGKFVLGGDTLKGRFSDLIGLVTFAGFADAQVTPTLDHHFVLARLDQLGIVTTRGEDGTAIGDAISLAVEKLNGLDMRSKTSHVKSKVIILLTDGENTAGELSPVEGAELAQALGIKIYTIGVGTVGEAPIPVIHPLTGRKMFQMMPVNIDEDTLRQVASITGGKYFRAVDTDSLEAIYREIDLLEKTTVESKQYTDYTELALQPYRFGWIRVPPLLILVLGTLTLRVLLEHAWLREFGS
jgi:Ca-activated chloride channel family protein